MALVKHRRSTPGPRRETAYLLLSVVVAMGMLAACAARTTVTSQERELAPRQKDCEIQFYQAPEEAGPHERIAEIETHVERNVFFGGGASLQDEAEEELRAQACLLGGDAVLISESIESSVSEMRHIHVWGIVVKKLSTSRKSDS